MYPTLFQIGPISVHSFGLMVAIAFIGGLYFMSRIVRNGFVPGLREDDVSQLLIFVMLGGALGARIAYVCEHWTVEFAGQPFVEVFRFDKGGLMFYGGLIGAILTIMLFSVIRKVKLVGILDLCAIVLPMGHAFGRIGCFLNGCCYGRAVKTPISVTYPSHSAVWYEQVRRGEIASNAIESLPVLPSQLIEAVANFALFAVLFVFARKKPRSGFISGIYLISYGVIRFFTEMLRSDPRMAVGALSIGQTFSICAIVAGVLFLTVKTKSDKSESLQG